MSGETLPPKTVSADKLVFWHNEIIEEEGLCHEEEIYGGADSLYFEQAETGTSVAEVIRNLRVSLSLIRSS